jgi:hypothetical protein
MILDPMPTNIRQQKMPKPSSLLLLATASLAAASNNLNPREPIDIPGLSQFTSVASGVTSVAVAGFSTLTSDVSVVVSTFVVPEFSTFTSEVCAILKNVLTCRWIVCIQRSRAWLGAVPFLMRLRLLTLVLETTTLMSTAPAATSKATSGGQSISHGAGSWIHISFAMAVGIIGGVGLILI